MMRRIRKRSAYGGFARRSTDPSPLGQRLRLPALLSEGGLRAFLFLALAGLITLLYPTARRYEYDAFREGKIAGEEVIAPSAFRVLKGDEELSAEVQFARDQVSPVLVDDPSVPQQRLAATDRFFSLLVKMPRAATADSALRLIKLEQPRIGRVSDESLLLFLEAARGKAKRLQDLRRVVEGILSRIYQAGLVESRGENLGNGQSGFSVLRDGSERQVAADAVYDLAGTADRLQRDIGAGLPGATTAETRALYELTDALLTPNLSFAPEETGRRREAAAEGVSDVKGQVLQGERIVDKHDRITSDHIDKLRSLARHLEQTRGEDPYVSALQAGGRAVLSALLLAILFVFLKASRPAIYRRTSSIVLFGILMLMPAFVAWYATGHTSITPYLVPVALSVMLATVLYDAEVGLVIAIVSSALCATILGNLQYGIVFLITGATGAYSVREVHHRGDFYRSIIYLGAAYTLTIGATAVLLYNHTSVGEFADRVRWDVVFGVFTACASAVLTVGLLPIFESVFNVVTTITLLELSDLNRPLLRNLAIRAPGTYSHSIVMASLSEAAADAIGADRLLVRVGCYYHDIGKMIRPHYFIENQKGINPHDELQPRMSALILISHVKEGIELAEEEGLPRAIINLIPQHHGTGEIASFKHRALERGDKQAVRDEDFRYPGPKPQTKEAGIINVADAVESATRTLSGTAPDQIRGMVQTIVKGRFTSGELDECDLTLRDLTKIQAAFMPILEATRHSRVPYPWQLEQQEQRERRRGNRERT